MSQHPLRGFEVLPGRLETPGREVWFPISSICNVFENGLGDYCKTAFKTMLTLRLDRFLLAGPETVEVVIATRAIACIVDSAPLLEEFSIILSITTFLCVPLDCLVGHRELIYLRKLKLVGLEVEEDALLSFFKRHSSSLREILLENIKTSRGTWRSSCRYMHDDLTMENLSLHRMFNR